MRTATTQAMLFTIAALTGLSAGIAGAAEKLPARKAGLWELKTAMEEQGKRPHEQTFKMCISDEMEANTVNASMSEHKTNCETYDIKKNGTDIVVDAKCTFNRRHVDSTTTMSGDFTKSFNVKIKSRTTDTKENTEQTIVIDRTITQTGMYLSESCGDLKAGEAATSDGAKVMVQ